MKRAAKSDRHLKITAADGVSNERRMADVTLDPRAGAAAIVESFSKPLFGATELQEIYLALGDRARDVRENRLSSVENMLTAQAAALNAIFLELARRAGLNMGEYINAAERYMRLALKAQSQCRATLETIATIKNPPVVYARQANIAAGHQQVNNGVGSAAREKNSETLPNELMETPSGTIEQLDTRATGAPVESNPRLEPLEAIHGSTDSVREGALKQERLQGRKAEEAPS